MLSEPPWLALFLSLIGHSKQLKQLCTYLIGWGLYSYLSWLGGCSQMWNKFRFGLVLDQFAWGLVELDIDASLSLVLYICNCNCPAITCWQQALGHLNNAYNVKRCLVMSPVSCYSYLTHTENHNHPGRVVLFGHLHKMFTAQPQPIRGQYPSSCYQ